MLSRGSCHARLDPASSLVVSGRCPHLPDNATRRGRPHGFASGHREDTCCPQNSPWLPVWRENMTTAGFHINNLLPIGDSAGFNSKLVAILSGGGKQWGDDQLLIPRPEGSVEKVPEYTKTWATIAQKIRYCHSVLDTESRNR